MRKMTMQLRNESKAKLQDKVAIITGSSEGIGFAIATTFLEEGAKVVINSRSQEKADAIAAQFRQRGYTDVLAAAGDVADRDACFHLVQQTIAHWGRQACGIYGQNLTDEIASIRG